MADYSQLFVVLSITFVIGIVPGFLPARATSRKELAVAALRYE